MYFYVVPGYDMYCIPYATEKCGYDLMTCGLWSEWKIRRAWGHSWHKVCIRNACWQL